MPNPPSRTDSKNATDSSDPFERHEHDVRNALAAAKGHTQLLRRHLRANPTHDLPTSLRHAEAVDQAIDRVVRLLHELRDKVRR